MHRCLLIMFQIVMLCSARRTQIPSSLLFLSMFTLFSLSLCYYIVSLHVLFSLNCLHLVLRTYCSMTFFSIFNFITFTARSFDNVFSFLHTAQIGFGFMPFLVGVFSAFCFCAYFEGKFSIHS